MSSTSQSVTFKNPNPVSINSVSSLILKSELEVKYFYDVNKRLKSLDVLLSGSTLSMLMMSIQTGFLIVIFSLLSYTQVLASPIVVNSQEPIRLQVLRDTLPDSLENPYEKYDFELRNEDESYINQTCDLEIESVSPVLKRIIHKPQYFFKFTPTEYRKHLDGHPFLRCDASIEFFQESFLLRLNISVRSIQANRTYGMIDNQAEVIFYLLNGQQLVLNNLVGQKGKRGKTPEELNYYSSFILEKSMVKKLLKSEIDRVRISWTSGYEEYEVFHVDVIKKQLGCIQQSKTKE
jgi:hypothetical protein